MLMIREQSATDRLFALRDLPRPLPCDPAHRLGYCHAGVQGSCALGTDRQPPDRIIGSCYSPMRQLPQASEPETPLGQFPH
jgi:hypothetical protein